MNPSSDEKMREAALWLASQADPPDPPVPALKLRFRLTAIEACEAIRVAHSLRYKRER